MGPRADEREQLGVAAHDPGNLAERGRRRFGFAAQRGGEFGELTGLPGDAGVAEVADAGAGGSCVTVEHDDRSALAVGLEGVREADDAALLWPDDMPTRADLGRQRHQLHSARVGGLEYLVQIDHGLRMYALYRPTLSAEEAAA